MDTRTIAELLRHALDEMQADGILISRNPADPSHQLAMCIEATIRAAAEHEWLVAQRAQRLSRLNQPA